MQPSTWFGITLAVSVAIAGLSTPVAQSVQLSDGRVYFTQPPSLAGAVTTSRTPLSPSATYYFTIAVPENAGEPLQRVTVVQRDGDTNLRRVVFDPDDTKAFEGTPRRSGADLTLEEVSFDRDTQTTEIVFNPPVPPGTTVTVGLSPNRNPRTGGVYLFGVTAFPAGENAYGQFLGYGRLDFNDPGDGLLFF